MEEKVCIECKETKPLDEYYKHPKTKDGRLTKCKVCCRRYTRARDNRERGRTNQFGYLKQGENWLI